MVGGWWLVSQLTCERSGAGQRATHSDSAGHWAMVTHPAWKPGNGCCPTKSLMLAFLVSS